MGQDEREPVYIVTDGEFDGPTPSQHSMLAFASVAVTMSRGIVGEFETVLERLEGATQDPGTMNFWKENPEAYAASTLDPQPAAKEMPRFVDWVRSMPGAAIFVSHPLALDGLWIDFYLRRFTGDRLLEGHWKQNRLFRDAPLCLVSYWSGRTGLSLLERGKYPAEWLGNQPHTHRAIDDARGYAHLLLHLMKMEA